MSEPSSAFRTDLGAVRPFGVALRVAGEIDLTTAPALALALAAGLRAAAPRMELVVDLGAVTYIDLRGYRTLVDAGREADGRGIGFRVMGCPPGLHRLSAVHGATRPEWWAHD